LLDINNGNGSILNFLNTEEHIFGALQVLIPEQQKNHRILLTRLSIF
jgi:hypothetical protein